MSLMKYAIGYLSKYSSSKNNLERILKKRIRLMKIEKKEKFILYNSIDQVMLNLGKNKFIDDNNYAISKIRLFAMQGKSKVFIKSYLIQKGIEKNILNNSLDQFEEENPEWEKKSAKIFVRKKKLENSNGNKQKNLSKMARAGFSYDISKEILEKI
jgi:regulatory protein